MLRWIALFLLFPLPSFASASFEPFFRQALQAQRLVSAFDLKLEKIAGEEALNRLQSSGLYCRIQEARANSELQEEALLSRLHTAFQQGQEAGFFRELSDFARKDSASAATAGQILGSLVLREKDICGELGCVASLVSEELPISPFDQNFTAFLETHRKEIALPLEPEDNELGACFSADSPRASYDWSKRSWISGNLSEGEFVITYDDGPHAAYTEQIQASWNATNYPKPAFFWLSENASKHRELVKSTHSQGFPVACHSERHSDLGNLAKAANAGALSRVNRETFGEELKKVPASEFQAWKNRTLDREILGAIHTIEEIVREADPSYRVKHFRLPFGSGLKNGLIGDRFAAADVDHFFWRVDSLDWQDKNPASVLKRVTSQMKSGKKGIILFHDIQAPTQTTTKMLIETFDKTPGWKPVSIRKMVP